MVGTYIIYYVSYAGLLLCGFFLGGSIASFLGVVIERVPKHESIMGRSHCACGRQLKWYENVPVLGWLAARGRTKCCNQKIPVWYFISELIAGIIGLLIAWIILNDYIGSIAGTSYLVN